MEILIFIFTAIVSYLLTKPTIKLAKKLHLVTDKRKRIHPAHTHTGIIPRAGGVPIFAALLLGIIIFIPLSKITIGILISSFLLLVVGIMDDHADISPYVRFLLNVLISALVVSFGLGIPYISNPFGGVIHLDRWMLAFDFFGRHRILILADLLAIFWLTWTMNMVNWSKGVDGQLPGFVSITALFLGLLSTRFTGHDIGVTEVVFISFAVSGAYLGFLPFNFYPQKIMPGYGGGALAGFLLGILSILSFGKLGTAVLILSVPMIDAIYTIIRRIKVLKSPFKADWGHFHHRLMEIGWGKRRIAVFYWVISLILGISSLFLDGIKKMLAFATVAVLLLLFMLIIERMKEQRVDLSRHSREGGNP